MKTLKIIATVTAFVALPIFHGLHAQETASQAPPIEQTLVREGDFAVKLVERLRIGTPQDEAEAETMLSGMGISPKNGWISDYPVTPDIIRELENTVVEAADAGRLPMESEEALRLYQDLIVEVGLNVVAETKTEYPPEQPSRSYSCYSEPTIGSYYYTYGPPVVTYYPPPGPYLYLYAWVPFPFWWTGWYFPGFYVLHNFHRCIHIYHPHHHHHHHVYVSNHWKDPKTKRVFVIDPSRRHTGELMRSRVVGGPKGFRSPEARRGAASIVEHSRGPITRPPHEVTRPGAPPISKNPISSKTGNMIERQSSNRGSENPSSHTRKSPKVKGPVGNQRMSRPPAEADFRGKRSKVSGRFPGTDRPNGAISPRVRGNQSRSYGPPTGSFRRSLNPLSQGGIRFFSPSNLNKRGSSRTFPTAAQISLRSQ